MVLRVLSGGGEWVRESIWGDSGVVSMGNVVVSEGVCWSAEVESWRSLVHVGIFSADVVVSGVFWGDSLGVWE